MGRKLSQETKDKISAARIELMKDPKARAHLSASLTGVKRSKEARQRMSESRIRMYRSGELKHPLQKYKLTKKQVKDALKRFKSQSLAAKFLGVSQMTLSRAKRKFNIDHDGKFFSKHGRGKGGRYKGTWMRSSWELAFAKFLSKNNIKWRYEPVHFKLKSGKTYRPDFYLVKENVYIEIKGHWYKSALEKFKQFKKEYPSIKILVIEEQIWKKPAKNFVRLLLIKSDLKKSIKKTSGKSLTLPLQEKPYAKECLILSKKKRSLQTVTTLL